MRSILGLLVACAAGLGSCCCIFIDERAWTSEDEWYRPYTLDLELQEVPDERFCPVTTSQGRLAELMLGDRSFLAITPEQAEEMTGTRMIAPANFRHYLIRGVYLNEGTGRFKVFGASNGVLLVDHGCLGAFPVPMKKRALVVLLQRAPTSVYVDCDMVQ